MLIKTTSTCRLQTVLLLVFCLLLPVCATVAPAGAGDLTGTTEARSAMDPDGVV